MAGVYITLLSVHMQSLELIFVIWFWASFGVQCMLFANSFFSFEQSTNVCSEVSLSAAFFPKWLKSFLSNKADPLCRHSGGRTVQHWLNCVLSLIPLRGPRWAWCTGPLFSDGACHQWGCAVNPSHIWEQIIRRNMAVGGNQCTWAARGSKTTLIGFGEVIHTEGTLLWQSWQPKAWIIKTPPCHFRLTADHLRLFTPSLELRETMQKCSQDRDHVPTGLFCSNGCNYTHFTFCLPEESVDALPLTTHCHLDSAYGLAPSWGNGWGGLSTNHWVINNQQLGGRPHITSTNLALISSPACFLPTVLPLYLPQSAYSLTFLSSCLHTWE